MPPTSRSVNELTQLGLTTYEARAYVALLGRDSFTAAQVSRQAGLPRQRIYDVLGSLVEKGHALGDMDLAYEAAFVDCRLQHNLPGHTRLSRQLRIHRGNM